MSDPIELGPHAKMTVRECLEYCARNHEEFEDVMVIGYDAEGNLNIRTSNMKRKDALWLLMLGIDYTRGTKGNDE